MADIVNIRPVKPESPFDDLDECLLKIIRDWRVARAEQQAEWARHNLLIGYGYKDDRGLPSCNTDALTTMQHLEGPLAQLEPRCVLAAQQLLNVANEIIGHKAMYPESVMGDGPAFEIVRNVAQALDWITGTTKLTRPAMPDGGSHDDTA